MRVILSPEFSVISRLRRVRSAHHRACLEIEPLPGTYVLVLVCAVERVLRIGQLGHLQVFPGFYVYVGSAFGPGGVRARVKHHCQLVTRPHWHIDYAREVMHLQEIWWTHEPVRQEHQWATVLKKMPGAISSLSEFGASDCACESHLYYFAQKPTFGVFCRSVLGSWSLREELPVKVHRTLAREIDLG